MAVRLEFDSGLALGLEETTLAFEYGAGMFGPEPEMRRLDAIRASLRDPQCSGPDPVYGIAMDIGREESTGLHHLEFIETRQHWFTKTVPHDTEGNLHVVSLVEGDAAIVESPTGAFAPFTVNYAEAFVVPAAVGAYTIRPAGAGSGELATLKAYVRKEI